MKKLSVAVIGTGSIVSGGYLPALAKHPSVNVVALCDSVVERAKLLADEYGIPRVLGTPENVLNLSDLNAVLVCTPNHLHAPQTCKALEAGKHVLVVKPMALSPEEGEAMVETARKAGKTLMVGLSYRFHPHTQYMKRFVDSGDLGEIYYTKASWLRRKGNPGGWFTRKALAGGGPLIDLGVHLIDTIWYLLGKPSCLSATGSTYGKMNGHSSTLSAGYRSADVKEGLDGGKEYDVEDLACGFLRFANGVTLIMDTSFALHTKADAHDVEIFGTKGGGKLYPAEVYCDLHGTPADIAPVLPKVSNQELEVAEFVDSILQEKPSMCPGEDGLAVLKMIDALYRSSHVGQEVAVSD
ncbi:MAG: Gfo/Idh/MocA family oxidoreductase [Armatimonadetes bacterium]|nr:Gfo/Idh/MocA family oxidoreductase [Armatimonadota bacterium]